MRFKTSGWFLALIAALLAFPLAVIGQETTGGLQGTVKDSTGAVVTNAHIVVRGTTLLGDKALDTDSSGYYRFANLPPGTYTVEVTAKGFRTTRRSGLNLEVGHLPTVDFTLEVGGGSEVVEVSGQAPVIDVTTNTNQTNVTSDVISDVPHGRTFQSVIQFAPMARNEPLAGYTVRGTPNGGTGGSLPGSSGNGLGYGFSVGGSGDAENSYLVEGQDTENISGGYSKANVPFDFIQEVQVKSSGIEAEHGGALGGVINVVMKKGGNAYHGEIFSTYEASGLDANQNNTYLRYDPTQSSGPGGVGDPPSQLYQPRKDHFRIVEPGVTVGGPIVKDRLWFFVGFAPQFNSIARTVNFGAQQNNAGVQYFTQDLQQYYGTARIDATLTQKIRVFGSWLDQYARETGSNLPTADPAQGGYLNTGILRPLTAYSHGLGWAAPNSTYNVGADISLSPKIVSTTRFGYFFENYHSFGWPTVSPNLDWVTSGTGGVDNGGSALPASLALPGGTQTTPYTGTYTLVNANKHYQFDQDIAFFKSGWGGTHNLKLGYQLNHLVNVISQNGNVPLVLMTVGGGNGYAPFTTTGGDNCALLTAQWGTCAGQYGYVTVEDFATVLTSPASDWNHAFFAQDAWTVGHGLTFNVGLRVEKENLPAPGGVKVKAIDFSWADKIEPRLGAAWDVMRNGKMKIFGSYGVVNDVMKLLLAQTSFGAQAFEECSYALGPDAGGGFSNADIDSVFVNGRACPNGPTTQGANFASGQTPAALTDAATGVSLIENINLRPWEPVAPGVKPYRQHEYVAGVDYQIGRDWAFEARYDRRRLDHILEDASLADKVWGETYTVVNPGEGVNRTIDSYSAYLHSLGESFGVPGWAFSSTDLYGPGADFGTCPSCPPNQKAVRSYDGLEFRLTKSASKHWAGMFSYTWSRLWGNYTGLTTTDQIDGGSTGRNSPDTTRAFDEPFYYFGQNGKSNNGPLPTDRPNTFKGYVYYSLPWKHQTTTFGLFQVAYQGTPVSSYIDMTGMFTGQVSQAVYAYGRGNWVSESADAAGNITLGDPTARRTPWFTQSDFNIAHQFKVTERQSIAFEANFGNIFGQHSVTSYYGGMNSANFTTPLYPGLLNGNPVSIYSGAAAYQILESPYSVSTWINGNGGLVPPVTKSSWYGQPFSYQLGRTTRFTLRFTF